MPLEDEIPYMRAVRLTLQAEVQIERADRHVRRCGDVFAGRGG
jgi:hypothetical protein